MADVPETIEHGRVTWTGFQAVADTDDPGQVPDMLPVSGTVTFSPGAAHAISLPVVTADGVMFVRRVVASIVDGVLVDADGNPGVPLVASSLNEATPGYFSWYASFTIDGVPRMAWPSTVEFSLPAGDTVDLKDLAPLPAGDITGQIAAYIATLRGHPGGLAGLDADGDVIDANGNKITGGGGPSGPVEWDDVQDKPTWAPVAFSGSYGDLSDRPVIPEVPATLPPTPGSVTQASMATGLVAMTSAERTRLASSASTADVAAVEGDVDGVATRTTTLEGNYVTLAGNMDNLGGRVVDLEGEASTLDARVTALEGASPLLFLAPGEDVPEGIQPPVIVLRTA